MVTMVERLLVKYNRAANTAMEKGDKREARRYYLLAALVCEQLPHDRRAFELAHVDGKLAELGAA